MSEMAKTVVFVAVAAAALLLGFVVQPGGDNFDVEEFVGERLNQFEVGDPKRLKIVKFDKETASTREFEVASDNGLWSIPSKQGYPADATKQMAEAATCLIDRQILKVAATSASEHQELGVIDPTSANLGSSSEGVGIRVTMTDSNDEKLVDMIIGKKVKDSEGQRFVRNADQDVVYVVELNADKLSTQFEDWIEKDLLQLNPLDIRQVQLKDYSAELKPALVGGRIQMQVSWDRRAEMSLDYNKTDSKWTADSLREFNAQQQEFVDRELAEDEELNTEALTKLRNGLDELLIVDVERKPDGLSADLKAGGDFLSNNEAINSLVERGFAPLQLSEDADVDILSSEGEVICTLEDGVEYVLRFGNLKMDGQSSVEESSTEGDEKEKDPHAGIDRYLFLMARFNEGMIEQPQLAELPELPEGAVEKVEESETESSAEDEAKDEESVDKENAAEGSDEEAGDESIEEQDDDGEAKEATDDADGKNSDEDENGDAEADEDANDSEADDATTEDATAEDAAKDEKSEELKSLIAARKMIETENQRRLSEYQDKLEAGRQRVQELNERFGDWYYVISNDVYKQIHLSLDQVITKKKNEAEKEQPESGLNSGSSLPGLPSLPVESAKPEVEAQPKPATEPEAKTEVKPEAEAKPEPKAEPAAEAEPEAETKSGSEAEEQPEAKAETEAAAE